jgi:predicted anti-sigma-YlaC factor YlaD
MAELVTDYLENALPRRTRLAAFLHLLVCSACNHYFDQMRRTARLLRGRPLPPPSRTVEDQIVQRIDPPPSP